MSSGKRLVSGVLGAILALGGVSAKRVSRSGSLSTGKKIAIGGAVLSLPTALLLWELSKVGSKSEKGSLLGKKGELAMAESEANPEVPSEEKFISVLNKLCDQNPNVFNMMKLIPGVKERNELQEFLKRNVDEKKYSMDFAEEVMLLAEAFKDFKVDMSYKGEKNSAHNLLFNVSCMFGKTGPFDLKVGMSYTNDGEETKFKELILTFLRKSFEVVLTKMFEKHKIDLNNGFDALLGLISNYLYYKCGGEAEVGKMKKFFDSRGWK